MERKYFKSLFFSVDNSEQEVQEVRHFLDVLCEEAYYKILPQNVVDFMKRNISNRLEARMINVLEKYQDYNVLFLPENNEPPSSEQTQLIFINCNACLTKQTTNISVLDYLYLIINQTAPEKICGYSNVPPHWQQNVYNSIIDYFSLKATE